MVPLSYCSRFIWCSHLLSWRSHLLFCFLFCSTDYTTKSNSLRNRNVKCLAILTQQPGNLTIRALSLPTGGVFWSERAKRNKSDFVPTIQYIELNNGMFGVGSLPKWKFVIDLYSSYPLFPQRICTHRTYILFAFIRCIDVYICILR